MHSLPTFPLSRRYDISPHPFPSVPTNTPHPQSTIGQDAGVQLLGTKLSANGSQGLSTNIAGIYAIGDANSDNVTNVPHAFFTGKRTAVFLHVQLERENSVAQIAGGRVLPRPRKREVESERALWARMNVEGDVTYAGEFDR